MAEIYGADGQPITPPSPHQDMQTQNGVIRLPIVGILDGQVHYIVNTITANILNALAPDLMKAAQAEQEYQSPDTPTASRLRLVE